MGVISAWSREGGLRVDFRGNTGGPRSAWSTVALSADELEECVTSRRPVLLAFDESTGETIVVGVRRDLPARTNDSRRVTGAAPATADADGNERKVIEADERLELRCGEASVTLTKEGKVIVDGAYVSVDSLGVLRLRGASVDLD